MSQTVSGATDIGTLIQASYNTGLLQKQIDQLSQETSTGLISTTYAGLGSNATVALNLEDELSQNATYQNNIDLAQATDQAAQAALGNIAGLATSLASSITSALTTGGTSIDILASTARNGLEQIAGYLNTNVGGNYIFAGEDSANPPIPNAGAITTSAFYTSIASAVGNLSTSGAAGVEAATLAASLPSATTTPFSATLEASNQPVTVDLGGGQSEQVGVLADQNTDAVSSGTTSTPPTSTGSYIRDLLRSFATIGAISSTQASLPGFETLLTDTLNNVQSATAALNIDVAGLGTRQNRLTSATTDLAATATALTTQLSGVQDANLATVASELTELQTQLQSSYQVIATLGELSLAKFLPAS
jgi:flagellar hook-associated protein 3 FlgL